MVLDTVSRWWKIENENANAEVGKALDPWLELARASKAAVLLIHHEGYSGHLRGASSFAGIVDQLVSLKPAGGNKRNLESIGRYDETPNRLVVELKNAKFDVVEPETKPGSSKKPTATQRIVACLEDAPGWQTAGFISDQTGIPYKSQTLWDGLKALKAIGRIEHDEVKGFYRLAVKEMGA